jgi:hypothetical protein
MNIKAIATKLNRLGSNIEKSKGALELLGLFLREESQELWDLVVAAPWLKASERTSFEYIANQLKKILNNKELFGLSRIVILEHGGVVLNSFITRFKDHKGLADVHYIAEGGIIIRRAYIITARSVSDHPKKKKSPRKKAAP